MKFFLQYTVAHLQSRVLNLQIWKTNNHARKHEETWKMLPNEEAVVRVFFFKYLAGNILDLYFRSK